MRTELDLYRQLIWDTSRIQHPFDPLKDLKAGCLLLAGRRASCIHGKTLPMDARYLPRGSKKRGLKKTLAIPTKRYLPYKLPLSGPRRAPPSTSLPVSDPLRRRRHSAQGLSWRDSLRGLLTGRLKRRGSQKENTSIMRS